MGVEVALELSSSRRNLRHGLLQTPANVAAKDDVDRSFSTLQKGDELKRQRPVTSLNKIVDPPLAPSPCPPHRSSRGMARQLSSLGRHADQFIPAWARWAAPCALPRFNQ
ncbi:hypothetical protein CORC01_06918 [Colletotrichum orchidophilum]|uniref:Uncharacterized protein n=1 Tax=Colletotrichum orchidophilum TaxID=1209926 RepID=A0A1G4B8P9_9PEZI|nr:uncharacterized protein CORC01_06918 [Colletotrichum orchidophilum]OHE97713.1 hypothetical protein CORC01_06918 [Colletotrichum orchidophilum]